VDANENWAVDGFEKKLINEDKFPSIKRRENVKLEIYGEEVIEKVVKASGNSGRIYLPVIWVGSRVKIIKLD
jgi:putative transposon-encoded protein